MNGFDKLMILKLEHLFGISKEDILSEELNWIEESDYMMEEILE
jgi:hypothetical protein